ncbi:hypothetical protein SCOR_11165 [Sulfidibacter corallicola]|uniref:Uncharacterized protein n=1 Tax=Sulfidibacter corallicola TaxID=2818388 RepID=A0A8A4TNE1_SULCO|nr:hypothetical protein [Sulfidibacter corallicola]QTD48105.1 hypothetical protein J3U87_21175 [Sulfidibacter corallicola]
MKGGVASSEKNRKKIRGKKRLVKKMLSEAAEFQMDLSPGRTFDLWQWQPSTPFGPGEFLQEKVESLFLAYNRVLVQVTDYDGPFQTWITVDESPENDNALYFHTPNPTGVKFPIRFSDVNWEAPPPVYLQTYLKGGTYICGRAGKEEAPTYFIFSNYHGLPLL